MTTIISEFSPASDGRHFNGTCTMASAAMCLTTANHLADDYQSVVNLMVAMRDSMYSRSACASNGAATVANMAEELRRRNADTDVQVNYSSDAMPYDWVSYLRAHAGVYPVLLQIAKCYNLASINPWSAGVQYHAIAVLGKQSNGYIVGDPNRPAGNTAAMIYPLSALQAASPCGMIALRPKVVAVPIPAPTPTGGTMNYPKGWDKTGDGMLGPASPIDGKRYLVRGGIQMTLEKIGLLRDDNVPIEDIHQDTDKVWRQAFTHFGLYWTDDSHYGLDAVVSRQHKQISDLQNQLPGPGAVASITAIQALKKAWSLV